ncbi:tetratricopeptide repeat protein [Laspinema sp. D1]|uniref:Tetratricopeptide repeat protein n=1 Tax=Laspinema palackyanum D2a TaxID=2953684 RepID=A0ABT2MJS8_9CYAN|nr:tetratricopeptide repeat protein [Laspinema sp. D2a]
MKYEKQLKQEIYRYNNVENIHDLPRAFHYISNKYLTQIVANITGFYNFKDFFASEIKKYATQTESTLRIASIGSGNCNEELDLCQRVELGSKVVFDCYEINPTLLKMGKEKAYSLGIEMNFFQQDFNKIAFYKQYDGFFANHSLHHVVELEKLFQAIQGSGKPGYFFLVNDMIGRNGHMSWPNAQSFLESFWSSLPKRLKWNAFFNKFDGKIPNFDCSQEGFEGIRAQDILRLLNEYFKFEYFVPFFSVINRIIDRTYGHNFKVDEYDPCNDIPLLEYLWYMDEHFLSAKYLPPTQIIAKVVDPRLEGVNLKSRFYERIEEACYSNYVGLPDVSDINTGKEGKEKSADLTVRIETPVSSENAVSNFQMGNELSRKGKLEEAIAYYRNAIVQNSNFSWIHHNLAEALVKQGQLDEAIACYRRALELNPNSAWSYYNLGEVLTKQGNIEEATTCYRISRELNPHFSDFDQPLQ